MPPCQLVLADYAARTLHHPVPPLVTHCMLKWGSSGAQEGTFRARNEAVQGPEKEHSGHEMRQLRGSKRCIQGPQWDSSVPQKGAFRTRNEAVQGPNNEHSGPAMRQFRGPIMSLQGPKWGSSGAQQWTFRAHAQHFLWNVFTWITISGQ